MSDGRMVRAAVAVCAVAMMGTGAGCGSDTGAAAARSGSASASSSHLVTQQEIDSYVLTQKDVPGHEISTMAGRTTDGKERPPVLLSGNLPRVSPKSCQHVYENAQQGSAYRQYARADDTLSGRDNVQVALIAYRPADAPKVVADLRAALPRGTAYAGPVDMTEGFEHPRVLPDPHLGDQSVEYRITEKIDSQEGTIRAPFHFLVVRKGSVIAWFMAHGFPGDTVVLPRDVINTQLAKLP
ncbi:hypothetical protein ACIRQQ_08700 [Streptomyces fuscichromogenes]|uniref:hypothetical protein n=1 Tax=Streptomyces fuscichromogenes TaxID=1324013 RepID=UPI00382A5D9B